MGERVAYATEAGILMVTKPIDGKAASFGNGITIGLSAPSVAAVDAFHSAGLAAGGTDEGAPGPRPANPNLPTSRLNCSRPCPTPRSGG